MNQSLIEVKILMKQYKIAGVRKLSLETLGHFQNLVNKKINKPKSLRSQLWSQLKEHSLLHNLKYQSTTTKKM